MNDTKEIDWYVIKNLFECLENYGFKKISQDFRKNDKIYSLEDFIFYNKTKLLVKKLNSNNIYIHNINCNFVKNFDFKQKKLIGCEKVNGIFKIYIWNPKSSCEVYNNTLYGIVSLLKYIDKYYCFNNFNLITINLKFHLNKNIIKIHPINGTDCSYKVIGCCYNKNYINIIPFVTYYFWSANKCFRNISFFKFQFKRPDMIINYLNDNIEKDPTINKIIFRGRERNYFRKRLYELYQNDNTLFDIKDVTKDHNLFFLDFIEQTKYKYMLDMHGLNGHSGRRYWMFHFNRVLFLPIDDPNKLFWEVSDNPPIPWVHFVPYSLNNLQELKELVQKLENDDNLYNKIKNECKNYANKYLSFDSICKYALKIFNE